MSAFVIGHLRSIDFGSDIVEYLERIDATLTPFSGRFVVHGSETTVLEGDWAGDPWSSSSRSATRAAV
ncbi:DUF1330 domain-containing protein, partial [Rhodococcus hoagii]|nr:DUF1330 domain-containing protein [Prescottella equi]